MGADPNASHIEQAKQHLREATSLPVSWPQSLVWAIDELIRHVEGTPPNPESETLRDQIAQRLWETYAAETGRSLPQGLADKLAQNVMIVIKNWPN
jgi:hypothetical protein